MIIGIGIDMVALDRIKSWTDEKHVNRILSKDELAIYEKITHFKTKIGFLGGRFAAKEAVFKAVSRADGNTNFKDISILNDENGKPYIDKHPFNQEYQFQISISHTDEYAISQAILERL